MSAECESAAESAAVVERLSLAFIARLSALATTVGPLAAVASIPGSISQIRPSSTSKRFCLDAWMPACVKTTGLINRLNNRAISLE